MEKAFYERLHLENAVYGLSSYNVRRLLRSRAISDWRRGRSPGGVQILDIGCGKGQFLLDLTVAISGMRIKVDKAVGLDLVRAEPNVFNKIQEFEFLQQSVDGKQLPFPDGRFDLVSCNHVLEHLFNTEGFLREVRRILVPSGLAVLSVPNIAAWMNRLAFLFGGQPLGSELGTERITYGFWPPFLKGRLERFTPSGHIRDFTPGGLRDLAEACGFRPVGWWAQSGGLLCSIFPRLCRNVGLLMKAYRASPG